MFGKVMSIPDRLMDNYFRLLTPLPEERITSLIDPQQVHPREAKDTLARTIVEEFHNADAANKAAEEFRRRFAEGKLPTDMISHEIPAGDVALAQLITTVGFAPSNSEARRLIQQGAASFAGQQITDARAHVTVAPGSESILQVGKRRVCKIVGKG
jgi:tyrosyl-tRNA synthetase